MNYNPEFSLGEAVFYNANPYFVCGIVISGFGTVRYNLAYVLPAKKGDPAGSNIDFVLEDEIYSDRAWTNVVIERDGNIWRARRPDFVNLQESPAGFASDLEGSIKALNSEEGRIRDASTPNQASGRHS